MVTTSSPYWNVASTSVSLSESKPTSGVAAPKGEVGGVSDARSSATPPDTVNCITGSMDASQVRLLRIAQLRDSVQAGEYSVSSSALANAMLDKVAAGQAPELTFLARK